MNNFIDDLKNVNSDPIEWILGYKALCSEGYQILPKATCQLIAEVNRQAQFKRITATMADRIKETIANSNIGDRVEFEDYKAIKIPAYQETPA